MTKIRLMSDLHLEFEAMDLEPAGEDVLVLAGDIGTRLDGFTWARTYSKTTGIPVVYVAGNHEFYANPTHPSTPIGHTRHYLKSFGIMSSEWHRGHVPVLFDMAVVIDGVRFIGGTLWTDFALYGETNIEAAKLVCKVAIGDYRYIWRDKTRKIEPDLTERLHKKTVRFIEETLRHPFDGPTVIVTHHAPSFKSVPERYRDHWSSTGFASNLDKLVDRSGARLWIHGHMHETVDYMIGETRVLANPRGYPTPSDRNPRFDSNLIVEV